MRAQDIAPIRLRAGMAFLSGCESARGRASAGEGVLGLSSAFLVAGVPAVVATLWPVDDAATARFVTVPGCRPKRSGARISMGIRADGS